MSCLDFVLNKSSRQILVAATGGSNNKTNYFLVNSAIIGPVFCKASLQKILAVGPDVKDV